MWKTIDYLSKNVCAEIQSIWLKTVCWQHSLFLTAPNQAVTESKGSALLD